MSKWIKTDTFQLVKRVNDHIFKVIDEKNISLNNKCLIEVEIDTKDYSEKEISNILKFYGYKSIEEVKKQYKENYLQIIVECIVECMGLEEGDIVCVGNNIDFDNYIKMKMEEK